MRKKLSTYAGLIVVVVATMPIGYWLFSPKSPVSMGMEWHEVRSTMEKNRYTYKRMYLVKADGQSHNTSETPLFVAEEYDSLPSLLGNEEHVVIQYDRATLHVCRLTVRPGPSLLDRVKKKLGL